MPDIFLYPGDAIPSCIILRDPTGTSGFNVYTHTGSGTLIFSGTAAIVKLKSPTVAGSLLFSGTSPSAKRKAFQPTGSLVFSSSGVVKKIKSMSGVGTLVFSGTAPKDYIPGATGGTRKYHIGRTWYRNQN